MHGATTAYTYRRSSHLAANTTEWFASLRTIRRCRTLAGPLHGMRCPLDDVVRFMLAYSLPAKWKAELAREKGWSLRAVLSLFSAFIIHTLLTSQKEPSRCLSAESERERTLAALLEDEDLEVEQVVGECYPHTISQGHRHFGRSRPGQAASASSAESAVTQACL